MQPLILTTSPDPFTRGLDYLYGLRSLALEPDMVDLVHDRQRRQPICTWIGSHIQSVNAQLNAQLQACHGCFHRVEQPALQIFAAPIAQSFGLDGLCNLHTDPITLLIDVGRVVPEHWLRLVVHEYAHAQVGSPGHHRQFARSLMQLCRGLQIALPFDSIDQLAQTNRLRFYPDCWPTQDPLAFWQGLATV